MASQILNRRHSISSLRIGRATLAFIPGWHHPVLALSVWYLPSRGGKKVISPGNSTADSANVLADILVTDDRSRKWMNDASGKVPWQTYGEFTAWLEQLEKNGFSYGFSKLVGTTWRRQTLTRVEKIVNSRIYRNPASRKWRNW